MTLLPPSASSASADEALSVRSAVCLRDGFPVLRGLHLTVRRGERVLVSGANGAGKTTLLRVLAGLLPLEAGDGHVLGHDLRRARSAVRRAVALVGHDSFCYDDLTVRANLAFHAQTAGMRRSDADDWLVRLGLEPLADRAHGRLSAGQRRRCALAAALVRRSELMLLDEPHAALDAAGRAAVDDAVDVAVRSGATVVLVSHEADRVRPLVDREVVVAEGSLRATTL